jgi:hypothetical protein
LVEVCACGSDYLGSEDPSGAGPPKGTPAPEWMIEGVPQVKKGMDPTIIKEIAKA